MDPVHSFQTRAREYKRKGSRAKDGLAIISEASKECHDIPGALGVKTGGWLVEEEQEARLERLVS
jgi:hypothetical protein